LSFGRLLVKALKYRLIKAAYVADEIVDRLSRQVEFGHRWVWVRQPNLQSIRAEIRVARDLDKGRRAVLDRGTLANVVARDTPAFRKRFTRHGITFSGIG
jgi:hypothetical protein